MSFSKSLLIVLLIHLCHHYSDGQPNAKFFRKDYMYIAETDSFYKIHTIHRTWADAKARCALEGASLFYPEDQDEANAVLTFWNATQPPFWWVFIGVSDSIAKGVYETIDGRPIDDVYNKWGPGEPNDAGGAEGCVILHREGDLNDDRCDKKYPFVCKKTLDSLEWSADCDMPNMGYQYNKDLGKCYKFHLKPKNWREAVQECSAELSYLAVVNSQAESNHLVSITASAPKDKVKGDFLRGAVLLGFHNFDGEWNTIKGTSLEDSGYDAWSPQEPNGDESEQCGSMYYNGSLNDLSCTQRCFFICEHDIGRLSNSFDDRWAGH